MKYLVKKLGSVYSEGSNCNFLISQTEGRTYLTAGGYVRSWVPTADGKAYNFVIHVGSVLGQGSWLAGVTLYGYFDTAIPEWQGLATDRESELVALKAAHNGNSTEKNFSATASYQEFNDPQEDSGNLSF